MTTLTEEITIATPEVPGTVAATTATTEPKYNGPIYILKKKFANYLPGHKLYLKDGKYWLDGSSVYFIEQEIKDEAMFEELPVEFTGLNGDLSKLGQFPTKGIMNSKSALFYSITEGKWEELKFEGPAKGTAFAAFFAIGAVLPLDATPAEKTARTKFIKSLI